MIWLDQVPAKKYQRKKVLLRSSAILYTPMTEDYLNKIAALILFGIGTGVGAMASTTPEIDPASGASALALLAGAVVVIRGTRRK